VAITSVAVATSFPSSSTATVSVTSLPASRRPRFPFAFLVGFFSIASRARRITLRSPRCSAKIARICLPSFSEMSLPLSDAAWAPATKRMTATAMAAERWERVILAGLRWGGERSGRPLPGPRQTLLPRAPIGLGGSLYHAQRTWGLAVVVGAGAATRASAGARRRPARRGLGCT